MSGKKRERVLSIILLISTFLALNLYSFSGLAQTPGEVVLFQDDFEGELSPTWELATGWQVVQDGENRVLAGEGHDWAYSGFSGAGDFRLQFNLKLIKGRIHLVYRLNETGRYFIGFEEGKSDLYKQYWPDTFFNDLTRNSRPHHLNDWHQVEIAGKGGTLRFVVDGETEWEYADPEPLLWGSFAFETLENSQAYIDDILVYGEAPTPTPTSEISSEWVRTGGPLGGLGYDVRMRPDNPDLMFVTDAWAGIFTSIDGGRTWQPSNEGISVRTGDSGNAIPVFCLTIDPHNPDVIWAGTQTTRGIFKSTDSGRTWVKMDKGVVEQDGITFRGITVDPRSSDIVYAAAELSSWVWNGQPRNGREFDMTAGVVYKTTDGGLNWVPIWRGNNLARYVWIDPRNPNVLFISTGIFDREAANSNPEQRLPGGEGVVKSTDGGKTWSAVNKGLKNLYLGTLFMHPQNPDILLAGTGNNQYHDESGVYLSTDGGVSWQHTLQGDIITAVEFAISDPLTAYAGSASAIYRSQDGGYTWQRVSGGEHGWGPAGVRAGFPIDLQVDPREPKRIFANEYGGGNFLSVDGGRTWTDASAGYTGAQVRDLAVDPMSEGRIYATARSGIFTSLDGGQSWEGLSYPPVAAMEWTAVAVDPTAPAHILAATNWGGQLVQSHDYGRSWQVVHESPGPRMGWRAIAFDPSDPKIVYAGTAAFFSAGAFNTDMPGGGIYLSQDGGSTWISSRDALIQEAHITYIVTDPANAGRVYMATTNRGIVKSHDYGTTWEMLNNGLPPSQAVFSIAIHPFESDILFAGLLRGGLYRSTDGGQHWQPSAAGLNPEASLTDILFDPKNPQVMYVADLHSGVYRSKDGGLTWTPLNQGLLMRAVNRLAITSDGQHLYAATEGGGVYRLDLTGEPPQAVLQPTRTVVPTGVPTVAPTLEPGEPTAVLSEPTTAATTPKSGPCSAAFALPLAIAGLAWLSRRKN